MIHLRMIHLRMIHLRMILLVIKTLQVGTDGRLRIQHKLCAGHHLLPGFYAAQNFNAVTPATAYHDRLRTETSVAQCQHYPRLHTIINQGVTRHLQYRLTLLLQLCLSKITGTPVTVLIIQQQPHGLAAQLVIQ